MMVVPTPLAEVTANLVRLSALSQFPAWRPFAYRFESKASLLSNSMFVDKPLDIHVRMSELTYDGGTANIGEVRQETYEISDTFSVRTLVEQSKMNVVGNDVVLARALRPTRLTVYYIFQKGKTMEDQNRDLIGADTNTVVFASRHTLVDDLGFKVEEIDDESSRITFFGCEGNILDNSLKLLTNIFSGDVSG